LVTLVVKDKLITNPANPTPLVADYKVTKDNKSAYNTPPVFSIYLAGLYFEYIKELGGVERMDYLSKHKSSLIYDLIDHSKGFYYSKVTKKYRSRMNIPFLIKDAKLEDVFIKDAKSKGLLETKGHKSVGGMRVSLYNGMNIDGVERLRDFMIDFQKKTR